MEEALGGGLGGLIQRSLQLEAALQIGVAVTLSEITCEEFACLAILKEERALKEAERNRNQDAG